MNYYKNFNFDEAKRLIKLALKEDSGVGDITSESLISENSSSKAELLAKENAIIAGLEIFKLVFMAVDKRITIKFFKKEGEAVKKGEVIGLVSGNTRKMLTGERVALNLLQRMSGVATCTSFLIKKLNNKNIRITDTRKTTPNMRIFEKQAVLIGGGANHRFGLYDMILIKDNHIEANGGIKNTLDILEKKKISDEVKVEIEVKDLRELEEVISKGKNTVDRVMLDNFKLRDISKAIRMNRKVFQIEISGGINEKNISHYSKFRGIDYISVGSLTHSVKSTDISLNFFT